VNCFQARDGDDVTWEVQTSEIFTWDVSDEGTGRSKMKVEEAN
jgi:hypothetical protein